MGLRDLFAVGSVEPQVDLGNPPSDRFSNVRDVSLQRGRVLGIIPVIIRRCYGGLSPLAYLAGERQLLSEQCFYFPSGNYFSALIDLRIAERSKQGRRE